jgi:PBP1b-binding outer membrane lipoprotein LpoB
MIKKIAIASIAVLALAGCASTADKATPTSAPAVTTAPPATDSYASPEDTFLADVHGMNDPYIESTTDSNLLDIGNATCTALDGGNTISDIVTYLADNGTFTTTAQANAGGMIIAAAVVDLCPEYTSQVQSFINS